MALIDVIKYDGNPNIFAWKYPNDRLNTSTQLIVSETQEAKTIKQKYHMCQIKHISAKKPYKKECGKYTLKNRTFECGVLSVTLPKPSARLLSVLRFLSPI